MDGWSTVKIFEFEEQSGIIRIRGLKEELYVGLRKKPGDRKIGGRTGRFLEHSSFKVL